MVLFTTLLILAAVISIIALMGLVAGGVAFIVVFGDLIVCVGIIVFITRWLFKRKKK